MKTKVKKPPSALEFTLEELINVTNAGEELAEAAARVCKEYDGIHRLRLALSKWYLARANEYGRDKKYKDKYERK